MRKSIFFLAFVFSFLSVLAQKKNVILILLDDLGYETIQCKKVLGTADGLEYNFTTPNMDSLGSRGAFFTNMYSTPICTPSRVELLTGKYSSSSGQGFGYLHYDSRTIANNAKWNRYMTGIVGKWQLNYVNDPSNVSYISTPKTPTTDGTRPKRFGFEKYCTSESGVTAADGSRYELFKFYQDGALVDSSGRAGAYGPRYLLNYALDFIETYKDSSFFLFYSMVLPHDPFLPSPLHADFPLGTGSASSQDAKYLPSMIEYADYAIGQVLAKLDATGLNQNTVLIVVADNGSSQYDSPPTFRPVYTVCPGDTIRGQKSYNNFLGTHVPAWVIYEGDDSAITPGDTITALIQLVDIYPTLTRIFGYNRFSSNDGSDFSGRIISGLPIVTRPAVKSWYNTYTSYGFGETLDVGAAAHNGRYAVNKQGQYFDMATDKTLSSPISSGSVPIEVKTIIDEALSTLPEANYIIEKQ